MNNISKLIGKSIILYIVFTYIIYLFMPISSLHESNQKEYLTIIFLCYISICVYFASKRNGYIPLYKDNSNSILISNGNLTILLIAFCVLITLYLFDLVSSGVAQLSLSMGDNYAAMLEAEQHMNSFWGQIYTLLSPVRILVIVYSIYYYKRIGKVNQILTWILLFIFSMLTISKGQFVGIGNVAAIILVPLFFKAKHENSLAKFKRQGSIVLFVFIALFIINQFVRAEALGNDFVSSYDSECFFISVFGESIGGGILRLFSYFTHGYKGLNYCLQLPFEWTNGYGGSRALDGYIVQYLRVPSVFDDTYPMRVEHVFGYDCQKSWPTAFAWWASDFTFIGVGIWMYFITTTTINVVKDVFYNKSIWAMSFLYQLVILLVFLPMNNQVFQTRDSLIATVGTFILWKIFK